MALSDTDKEEMYKIIRYLTGRGRHKWVDLLQGIMIHLEEESSSEEEEPESHPVFDPEGDSEESEVELDDNGCIPEGVPDVKIDEQGFHSLA